MALMKPGDTFTVPFEDPKPDRPVTTRTIEGSNDGETWTTVDPMASSEGYMYLRTRHEDGLVSYHRWPPGAPTRTDRPVTWGELAELATGSNSFAEFARLLREKAEGRR